MEIEAAQPEQQITNPSTEIESPPTLHGFDFDKLCVKSVLFHQAGDDGRDKGNAFKAVGIFGVEGVGKTALAQSIFDDDSAEEFEPHKHRIDLTKLAFTEHENRKVTLVKGILRQIGVGEERISQIQLQQEEIRRKNNEAEKPSSEIENPRNAAEKGLRGITRTLSRTLSINKPKSEEQQPQKEKAILMGIPETSAAVRQIEPDPPATTKVRGLTRTISASLGINTPESTSAATSKKQPDPAKKSAKAKKEETPAAKKSDPGDPVLGGLVAEIYKKLAGNKYLILLDGVWNFFDEPWYQMRGSVGTDGGAPKWEKHLGYGFPKDQGGAVIVTGRSEMVLRSMVGRENVYRLLPLKDEDNCWRIYEEAAKEEAKKKDGIENWTLPSDSVDAKHEIFRRCSGIPSAARMMGQVKYHLEKEKEKEKVDREENTSDKANSSMNSQDSQVLQPEQTRQVEIQVA